jgi:uncharacterized protein YjbI with pentapeptide repeats
MEQISDFINQHNSGQLFFEDLKFSNDSIYGFTCRENLTLQGVNFSSFTIESSDLPRSIFKDVVFCDSELIKVNISESTLTYVEFNSSTLREVSWTKSRLRRCSFKDSIILGCSFFEADLTDLAVDSSTFYGCDFRGAYLAPHKFPPDSFVDCQFS